MQRCGVGLNKGLFRLISLALLLTLVLAVLVPGAARANPGWYDTNWQYRKKITINSANISADLTDFPVLISLASDTDLASDALNNGDDILFTAADEVTQLSHEIESFNGISGKLVAWVKIPSLSSSVDTDIYMYYGNSGASNQENATAVWDSNYKMVQHLQESSGGANAIKDSTSNANHGTDNNSPTFSASGQINSAIGFDGSDDYIVVSSPSPTSLTDFTVSGWVNWDSGYTERGAIFSTDSFKLDVYLKTDNTTEVWIGGSVVASNSTVQFGTWEYWVATRAGSTVKLYRDGAFDNSAVDSTSISGVTKYFIGSQDDSGSYDGKGTLDEVRISDNARSADWILTGYNNQSNPSGFITLGSEETGGAPAVVGGIVYPVDKVQVLAPWLLLFLGLSLAATGGALKLRQRAWSRFN